MDGRGPVTEAAKPAAQELRLRRVSRENSDGLEEMAQEFHALGETPLGLALSDRDAFFDEIDWFERGEDLPADRVRMSSFWLCRGERLLGSSRLRHRLIPVLELDGGNIGYEIRPSERGQGFGKELLRLTLDEARAIGLSRALLTAEPTNRGSLGVIEANAGVPDGTSISPRNGRTMNRYWIEL